MNRPEPKREIVVRRVNPSWRWADITTASPDAESWVQGEAVRYGSVFSERDGKFALTIDPNWDYEEVCAYLESGGV